MPRLSDKGLSLPPSPIRKLVPYAEEAARHGVKVYHLNIGQPDIPTPQVAIDAVKNIHDKIFAYGHSAGLETYRRKLVGYYQSVGIELGYENLLITDGGSEAIFMAMSVCLSEGDEVLIPEPFYANYNGFAVEAGIKVKTIPASIDNDFALPPIEEFDRHITPRTKAILICNPNNPTGYLYSQQELEQHIFECDLLIIDDLGTELVNSFVSSQLFLVLNERILRRKSTLISTNLSLGTFADTYSERIFSRISSTYTMLRLIGDDIRIQKKLSAGRG